MFMNQSFFIETGWNLSGLSSKLCRFSFRLAFDLQFDKSTIILIIIEYLSS